LEDAPILESKKRQQVELSGFPTQVDEYHRVGQQCTQCDKTHFVPWPEDLVKAGLVGPRLTAPV